MQSCDAVAISVPQSMILFASLNFTWTKNLASSLLSVQKSSLRLKIVQMEGDWKTSGLAKV
jgi:hypothetical protein